MTFPSRYQRDPPPTSTIPIKDLATSLPLDPEKSHVPGNEVEGTTQSFEHHVLPDTERKVVRKMDFRIVPLVTALYILAFLDRSNIGKYVFTELRSPLFPLLDHTLSLETCLGLPSIQIVAKLDTRAHMGNTDCETII